MFVSQTHLPQRFAERHYTDPAFHDREVEKLFLPGWHCIAAWDQFKHDGDFRTFELLNRPLILWRTGNTVQTFLNVCAHRFCTLTDKSTGRFKERLKCQYHGWEYDQTGNTCKIPDAQSFRPLTKGELGLKQYRTEMVGQLIFVTLNDDAPTLREFLGPELVEFCERWFTPEHRLTFFTDLSFNSNWKIVTENVLEAYHIECVHAKTFKRFPIPEHCTHEFFETYDHYVHDFHDEPDAAGPERLAGWFTGQEQEFKWHHILRYPNVVLGGSGPFHYIQMIWPLTANTSRSTWITMHYSGQRGGVWSFLKHRILLRIGNLIGGKVQREDAGIYPSVHRGTAAPDRPHGGGLISAREERIFTFQDYVLRETGEAPAAQPPQRLQPAPKDNSAPHTAGHIAAG